MIFGSSEMHEPTLRATVADPVEQLLTDHSVEVMARSASADQACRDHVAPGTEVFVAFVPGEQTAKLVETTAKLVKAGFHAVPHVVARGIPSRAHLDDLVARLAGEAGATRALVLGGDIDTAAGPFSSSLSLLETGVFQKYGIRDLSLATYPEIHPKIATEVLDAALMDKLALVKGEGLTARLVSQFCFEAAPILAHVERLRAKGVTLPVRIGLAGPADRKLLFKYAIHCGIGNSIRALGSKSEMVGKLLSRESPDGIVAALAADIARKPDLGIQGVHIFTFGGLAESEIWASRLLAERRKASHR